MCARLPRVCCDTLRRQPQQQRFMIPRIPGLQLAHQSKVSTAKKDQIHCCYTSYTPLLPFLFASAFAHRISHIAAWHVTIWHDVARLGYCAMWRYARFQVRF